MSQTQPHARDILIHGGFLRHFQNRGKCLSYFETKLPRFSSFVSNEPFGVTFPKLHILQTKKQKKERDCLSRVTDFPKCNHTKHTKISSSFCHSLDSVKLFNFFFNQCYSFLILPFILLPSIMVKFCYRVHKAGWPTLGEVYIPIIDHFVAIVNPEREGKIINYYKNTD